MLFELIAAHYERRSLLITANQPFGEWGKIFTDKTMTLAAIDRLVPPRHDPGDERGELSPQGRAQTQAWQKRLTVMAVHPQEPEVAGADLNYRP